MDESSNETPNQENTPKLRGLYRHVKISVKALDWIIVACVVVILVAFLIDLPNLGFTVKFDSMGGSDVPSQTRMFGEQLEAPEPPTREGYTFTGWYKDQACYAVWDLETDTVEADMTLYAGWQLNK